MHLARLRDLRSLRLSAAENGLPWTFLFALRSIARHVAPTVAKSIDQRMKGLERERLLPGANSVARNRLIWNEYNWDSKGEEWNPAQTFKQSVIEHVLLAHVKPGGAVLEIGPGNGRWTETLAKISRRLVVVDLSTKCIDLCRQRFAGATNIEYHVNDGSDLDFLDDASLDYIWSFDVFVHVAPEQTERYLAGIARTLKPGGLGVIHHPNDGSKGQWRSRTDATAFAASVANNGMTVLSQFDRWGPNGAFGVRDSGDIITIFRR